MKVLLVGPYPPPHGGISVHVWSAHTLMKRAGLQSSVLNVDPRAPESDEYIRISGGLDLGWQALQHAYNDWFLQVHTNGHNTKSWLIALACGLAAQLGPGGTLTLHSGLVPEFFHEAPAWRRSIARVACMMYSRIVCVNSEIAKVIGSLGVPADRLEITPAFLPVEVPDVTVPQEIEDWFRRHSPVITSAMFFRPEYGFELLIRAAAVLKERHPGIGFFVLGSGEEKAKAEMLVHENGLSGTIRLAGDVDHELCLALMARSSVFLRPTFRDGDSMSVREAASLGVPVVASNVGTRPAGTLLFKPGDLIELVEQMEKAIDGSRLAPQVA